MKILDTKGLSGIVKLLLDTIFIGGAGIFISLPVSLKWYINTIHGVEGENYYFLLGFLYVTGFLALLILYETRKIFQSLNQRNPFTMRNVKSLRHMAFASFVISISYVVKIIFFITIFTVITGMVFVMAGVFLIILSEVFHQAYIVKEENDLTI